ncbi:MAG: hypothetical protein R2758_15155 [Bacteroidales bacterium]
MFLPIGVTILVIYLFSLYLSCLGFHRQAAAPPFLELLLMAAFLTAAPIGLSFALKITYRWEVKFAESLDALAR